MRARSIIPVFLAMVVVAGCSDEMKDPSSPAVSLPQGSVKSADSDEGILYQARDGATAMQTAALEQILDKYGFTHAGKVADGKVDKLKASKKNNKPAAEIAAEIEATGAVDFAEVDAVVALADVPSDPLYSTQWHHAKIGSEAAWNTTHGSASILVGVCDTGVEITHPDLYANIQGPGYNVIDYTADGRPYAGNPVGHGTKVSGVIGAMGNNGEGVAGMNWVVRILPIRVTNNADGSASMSKLIECIDYARTQGAKIVNVSYSGVAWSAAVNTAGQALRNAGGLLFVSAGNDTVNSKAKNYPYTIVVGATEQTDKLTAWSNYGKPTDIVAPGSAISTTRLSTNVNGPYGADSGTSFSSPLVAGVAALIWAANPALSPATVESILYTTAVDLGARGMDATFGYGRVNAAAAIAKAVVSK